MRSVRRVAPFLLFSGMCSLIYETVWIRELRLVFGASTSASAAVVACFIGGLGVGGLLLGKRADRHPRPLALYATLETAIALSAAITPLLLGATRSAYVVLGGTRALGAAGGAVVRLLLSALVFAVPTLAMGGTLPAAARAVREEEGRGRPAVALLYGVNTLGAVIGCMATTFLLLEVFGTRLTLWMACLMNLLVAMIARSVARSIDEVPHRAPEAAASTATASGISTAAPTNGAAAPPRGLVLFAAAVTGFVFCLMEIVWYRMLGPLLGGSVFTFGLILAVALAGIGAGGVLYAVVQRRPPTLLGFAWTCTLEALLVAVPYALGDRLAMFAAIVRPVGALGFSAQVLGWTAITGIVVFPAAIVTGAQFPLLIALLGRGETDLGRDVGMAYACNTAGSIAGSLCGGFGLLPLLTAPGCWRVVSWLLVATGLAALALHLRAVGRRFRSMLSSAAPVVAAVLAVLAVRATGPSAAWRHSPIGAGRVDASLLRTPNAIRAFMNKQRRAIVWQADGRESSVAISRLDGVAFIVNGKNDGNARSDAPTAVMLGLVGAMLQSHPQRAMVIGLGTGSSAGWLGAVPSITAVDVAELEPAIVEVARRSAAVNHGVLDNPKVHLIFADAREALLTSRQTYDVIASEPSNPYRAGVASLFTREYYQAGASRLSEDGIFVQWVQGYEVDGQTMRTVYATLASVFPYVETWEAEANDVLLVASKKPIDHGVARLRARIAEEPFRSALAWSWRATDLEGVLGHYVAGPALTKLVAEEETELNTDDQNAIEFGFARALGVHNDEFNLADVRTVAGAHGARRPEDTREVDWSAVDEHTMVLSASGGAAGSGVPPTPGRSHRMAALEAAFSGNLGTTVSEWRAQPAAPVGSIEVALLATALADAGDESALPLIERARDAEPVEADLALGRLRARKGDARGAWDAIERAYVQLRIDPWPLPSLVVASLNVVVSLIEQDPSLAPRIYATLREPFALRIADDNRMSVVASAATRLPPGEPCVSAFAAFEPNPNWDEDFLLSRAGCYLKAGVPIATRAERDVRAFRLMRAPSFAAGL